MSDDDKDEEISTSFCPYKKAKGFFSGMFSGSKPENIDIKSTAITTERSLNESDDEKGKCPFGFDKMTKPKKEVPKGKCPYGYDNPSSSPETSGSEKEKSKEKDQKDLDDDVDSDEEDKPQEVEEDDEEDDGRQSVHFRCYGLLGHAVNPNGQGLKAVARGKVADHEIIQ